MIKKFDQFILEAKGKKEDNTSLVIKLLDEKPTIKMTEQDEKGAYSLAAIKKYFRENGKTNDQADEAIYTLNKSKSTQLDHVSVKSFKFNGSIPLYYKGLTKEESLKIKEDYEEKSKEINKDFIEKKKEVKKLHTASSKDKKDKKASAKKAVKSITKRSTDKKDKKD